MKFDGRRITPQRQLMGVLVATSLIAAGCSSASESTAGSSTATSSTSSTSSTATSSAESSATAASSMESVTSSDTAAEPAYAAGLQPQIDEIAEELLIAGGVVLVRSPTLGDWSTAFGTRTWKGNDPVTVDDHIRIGSNTKTWTGTVILQLVEQGKIALDDPVSKYRPDVPNGDNITIAQMLDMRSGLANYTTNLALNEEQDANPGRAWQPEELVAMGLAEPPEFAPGQGWFYSNTNTVLLGLIIEQLTGKPVAEVFRSQIFDPLGLSDSSFPAITDGSIPAPFPRGYTFGTNVGTIESNELSPEIQAGAKDGTLQPNDVTDLNPSWGWTAGAGISTAGDLAVYVKALVGGGLLSPELQEQRIASVTSTDPANPAASNYGWALGEFPGGFYGHSGELPGYNSFMGYDPATDTTVVTWATNAPAADGNAPAIELAKAVIGALAAG